MVIVGKNVGFFPHTMPAHKHTMFILLTLVSLSATKCLTFASVWHSSSYQHICH